MANKYRVRVLNNRNRIIFDQEIEGLEQALETGKAVLGAFNIGCTNVKPDKPGYFEHKFEGGWRGITGNRFEQMVRRGQETNG